MLNDNDKVKQIPVPMTADLFLYDRCRYVKHLKDAQLAADLFNTTIDCCLQLKHSPFLLLFLTIKTFTFDAFLCYKLRHTQITAVLTTNYNRNVCLLIPMITDMFNILTGTQYCCY